MKEVNHEQARAFALRVARSGADTESRNLARAYLSQREAITAIGSELEVQRKILRAQLRTMLRRVSLIVQEFTDG